MLRENCPFAIFLHQCTGTEVVQSILYSLGKTVLDPDLDVDDGGLPREKPMLPKK